MLLELTKLKPVLTAVEFDHLDDMLTLGFRLFCVDVMGSDSPVHDAMVSVKIECFTHLTEDRFGDI